MRLASCLRPALGALLLAAPLGCASAAPAAPSARAAAALVRGVSFESDGSRLTVRVRTTGPPRSFSVERDRRAVRLVLVGAVLSPSLSRGRAEAPVRDYRLEAAGDRVTLVLDADGAETPRASLDGADVVLTFGGEAPRRTVAWGGLSVPDAGPDPARRTAPRHRARRAPAPSVPVAQAPPPSSRPEAPRPAASRPVATQPVASVPAPSTSPWGTAPQVPVQTEAPATYAGTGETWRLDTIVLDAGHGGHDARRRRVGRRDATRRWSRSPS